MWNGNVIDWRIWTILLYPHWQLYGELNIENIDGKTLEFIFIFTLHLGTFIQCYMYQHSNKCCLSYYKNSVKILIFTSSFSSETYVPTFNRNNCLMKKNNRASFFQYDTIIKHIFLTRSSTFRVHMILCSFSFTYRSMCKVLIFFCIVCFYSKLTYHL